MPTPKRGPRLGGGPAHQKQILANQASDLFRYGRLKTTEAKAKALRPYAERLITKAKQGDLHARRQVLSKLHDRDVVAYLFEDVAPRFSDRNGGYTRILKLGPRRGDNAPLALIELVDLGERAGDEVIEEAKQSRMRGLFGRRRRARQEATTDGAFVDEFDEDVYVEEELTDEQVAAAVREATGAVDTDHEVEDTITDEVDPETDEAAAEDATPDEVEASGEDAPDEPVEASDETDEADEATDGEDDDPDGAKGA